MFNAVFQEMKEENKIQTNAYATKLKYLGKVNINMNKSFNITVIHLEIRTQLPNESF